MAVKVTSMRWRRSNKASKSKQDRGGRHKNSSGRPVVGVNVPYGEAKEEEKVASSSSAFLTASASTLLRGKWVGGRGVGRVQKEKSSKVDTEGREEGTTAEGKERHAASPTAARKRRTSLRSMVKNAW